MITVIGAGMAGLLAGAMLRNECSFILEAQSAIPNNHSAVLRFRSSIVGDVLGFPFKPVQMMKAHLPWRNPVADAIMYSRLSNGEARLRSSISADGSVSTRYIAPPDLIQRMVDRVSADIRFDCSVDKYDLTEHPYPIISTMPMPVLMDLLGWEDKPEFKSVSGININSDLEDSVDVYASLYNSDPARMWTRASLTGSRLTLECPLPGRTPSAIRDQMLNISAHDWAEPVLIEAAQMFGLDKIKIIQYAAKIQSYSKIIPIDEGMRKRFMSWATEKHNIYSLGRFATWKPGLLLDDVVSDVRAIQSMVRNGHNYDHKR